MWRALGDPILHFAIIRGAIQKGRLFSWILCQFSPFRWSNFDLELIYFALSMNTSSYSTKASGTYNRWKVEFVLKNKNDRNINTTQALADLYTKRLYTTGLSPPVFLYWPFQGGTSVVVPYCYLFLLSVFILWFSYYVSDIFCKF